MNGKNAAVLYNKLSPVPTKDEEDVLAQRDLVAMSLENLGYKVILHEVDLNLKDTRDFLLTYNPAIVFNLVESIDKKDHLAPIVPLLLDTMAIPYTGCSSEALALTLDKASSKKLFALFGINTPRWSSAGEIMKGDIGHEPPYIIKSLWDHASAGLEDDSIAHSRERLKEILIKKMAGGKTQFFAEEYIDGREFNISVLGGKRGPETLPCAEIRFVNFNGRPKIVGYRAKWIEDSLEYSNTPRSFEFREEEKALLQKMKDISLVCWEKFSLRGYARVDFRVDGNGIPYVLEINANPCISPDSGFIAAAAESGLGADDVIARIIDDTLKEFYG